MIQTVPFNSSSSLSSFVVNWSRSSSRTRTIHCSLRNYANIPKLGTFSRSKIDRILKEPPLIQKSETELLDYCTTLEGDDCYSCWMAYFELEQLKEEVPKEELERLIINAGGLKSFVDIVHRVSAIYKAKKECKESMKHSIAENTGSESMKHSISENTGSESMKHSIAENTGSFRCPIPDGLPKTLEELEEEERARMPDSQFTRLLRTIGGYPAWYTPRPDHETD